MRSLLIARLVLAAWILQTVAPAGAARARPGAAAPTASRTLAAEGSHRAEPAAASRSGGRVSLSGTGIGVLFADLDGDRQVDPIVVHGDERGCLLERIYWHDGARGAPLVLGARDRLVAPFIGDADGDGTPDILSFDADGVLMLEGRGQGTFAPRPSRLVEMSDLLIPSGCSAYPKYFFEGDGGAAPELILPVLGGVRVVPLGRPRKGVAGGSRGGDSPIAAGGTDSPIAAGGGDSPIATGGGDSRIAAGGGEDLLTEPQIEAEDGRLTFISPLPVIVGSGASRVMVLGPVLERDTPRLELSWWTRGEDASLQEHRTALALPPRQRAAAAHPFDVEGDGRPEIAVLTAPVRLTNFLGEYELHVYRASDRADAPVEPFYSGTTNINYWQLPAITTRPAPGGQDLLLAFYRGLRTSHLNVEIFRSNGNGSFEPKHREIALGSDKEANRGFLRWADVDADGTTDLLTAGSAGIHVFPGLPARDRPLAGDPAWTCPGVPQGGEASFTVNTSGAWHVSLPPEGSPFLRDLDGDGVVELIFLQTGETGEHAMSIVPLRRLITAQP